MNVLACPTEKGARGIWARPRPLPSGFHRNFMESLSQDVVVAISQGAHDKTQSFSQRDISKGIAEAISSTVSPSD